MDENPLLAPLVDCVVAGIRQPKKCLARLLALRVDVPDEVTEQDIADLLASQGFALAVARAKQAEAYDLDRVRENRAKYRLNLEALANGDDARTAFAANVKLLAYGGMVEVQKHEVDVLEVIKSVREALKAEDGEGAAD